MAAHIDRIDTGSVQRTPEGYRAEVVAVVTDVPGDIWSRRFNALRTPGLPAFGSVHPAEPSIFLLEEDVEPLAGRTRAYEVRLGYRPPSAEEGAAVGGRYGPTTWAGDVTTYSEETIHDVDGRLMTVGYLGRPTNLNVDPATGRVEESPSFVVGVVQQLELFDLARVQVDRPTQIMRASRWERDNPETAVGELAGALNAARFRDKAPRTVLCQGVRFQSADTGGYRVEYEFAYRPAGWAVEARVSYRGKIPIDAREGNGIKTYDVYPARDFGALQL